MLLFVVRYLGESYVFVLHVERKTRIAMRSAGVIQHACRATEQIQVVQLRPGGTLGTQLWPLSVDLHKTVASLVGRLCATLIAGMPALTLLKPEDLCLFLCGSNCQSRDDSATT